MAEQGCGIDAGDGRSRPLAPAECRLGPGRIAGQVAGIGDDAAGLVCASADGDMAEAAADIAARWNLDVAAGEDGRDQQPLGRLCVDLLGDQPDQMG